MSLTGLPFLLVVLVLTVGALVWGAVRLPARRRTVGTVVTRLLAQLGVSALVLLSVAVVMNNQNGWYASWGDLFGTGGTSTVRQSSGGTSAEAALQDKPKGPGLGTPVPVASLPPLPSPGHRVQTFAFTGSRSGLSGLGADGQGDHVDLLVSTLLLQLESLLHGVLVELGEEPVDADAVNGVVRLEPPVGGHVP